MVRSLREPNLTTPAVPRTSLSQPTSSLSLSQPSFHPSSSAASQSRLPRPVSLSLKKRPVLGERNDNVLVPASQEPISSGKQHKGKQPVIVAVPRRSTVTMSKQTRPVPSPRKGGPRQSIDLRVNEGDTMLLDVRMPAMPFSDDTDWSDHVFEQQPVVIEAPRGMGVRSVGRMMTPADSQEVQSVQTGSPSRPRRSPQPPPTATRATVSRLPTPPSSQSHPSSDGPASPGGHTLTARASKIRARPVDTPPRARARLSHRAASQSHEGTVQEIAIPLGLAVEDPSPNPRRKKSPRIVDNPNEDREQHSTPRLRSPFDLAPAPKSAAGSRKSTSRTPSATLSQSTSSNGSSSSKTPSQPSTSRRKSASQPISRRKSSGPASSSHPADRRKSTATTTTASTSTPIQRKSKQVPSTAPQPRRRTSNPLSQSRSQRHRTPAHARTVQPDRRKSMLTPQARKMLKGRKLGFLAEPVEGEGEDPLLLKPAPRIRKSLPAGSGAIRESTEAQEQEQDSVRHDVGPSQPSVEPHPVTESREEHDMTLTHLPDPSTEHQAEEGYANQEGGWESDSDYGGGGWDMDDSRIGDDTFVHVMGARGLPEDLSRSTLQPGRTDPRLDRSEPSIPEKVLEEQSVPAVPVVDGKEQEEVQQEGEDEEGEDEEEQQAMGQEEEGPVAELRQTEPEVLFDDEPEVPYQPAEDSHISDEGEERVEINEQGEQGDVTIEAVSEDWEISEGESSPPIALRSTTSLDSPMKFGVPPTASPLSRERVRSPVRPIDRPDVSGALAPQESPRPARPAAEFLAQASLPLPLRTPRRETELRRVTDTNELAELEPLAQASLPLQTPRRETQLRTVTDTNELAELVMRLSQEAQEEDDDDADAEEDMRELTQRYDFTIVEGGPIVEEGEVSAEARLEEKVAQEITVDGEADPVEEDPSFEEEDMLAEEEKAFNEPVGMEAMEVGGEQEEELFKLDENQQEWEDEAPVSEEEQEADVTVEADSGEWALSDVDDAPEAAGDQGTGSAEGFESAQETSGDGVARGEVQCTVEEVAEATSAGDDPSADTEDAETPHGDDEASSNIDAEVSETQDDTSERIILRVVQRGIVKLEPADEAIAESAEVPQPATPGRERMDEALEASATVPTSTLYPSLAELARPDFAPDIPSLALASTPPRRFATPHEFAPSSSSATPAARVVGASSPGLASANAQAGPSSAQTPHDRQSGYLYRPTSRLANEIIADSPERSSPQRGESMEQTRETRESTADRSIRVRPSRSRQSLHEELATATRLEEEEADEGNESIRSVVEVSSLDPRAAARAAAILKLNHKYIEHGILDAAPSSATSSHFPESSFRSTPKHIRRKSNPAPSTSSYDSPHFASADTARQLSKDELLHEAELEIVHSERYRSQSRGRRSMSVMTSGTVMDSPKLPGAWRDTPKAVKRKRLDSNEEVQPAVEQAILDMAMVKGKAKGKGKERAWGVREWKALEKVFREERKKWLEEREVRPLPASGIWGWARRASMGFKAGAGAGGEFDVHSVVERFWRGEGVREGEVGAEWARDVIALRVKALERRVESIAKPPAAPSTSSSALSERSPKKARRSTTVSDTTMSTDYTIATPGPSTSTYEPPSTIRRVLGFVWGSARRTEQGLPSTVIKPAPRMEARKENKLLSRLKEAQTALPPPPPPPTMPREGAAEVPMKQIPSAASPIGQAWTAPKPSSASVTSISQPPRASTSTSRVSAYSTPAPACSASVKGSLYPPLNPPMTQRSSAIRALFSDSPPTVSAREQKQETKRPGPIPIPQKHRGSSGSVKNLVKSFEEGKMLEKRMGKGGKDQGLRRTMSGSGSVGER